MGLFGFLKKKQELIELKEKDLYPFFEKTVNSRFNKINAKLHEINVEVKYHVRKLKEYADVLQDEELMNPKIHPKEHQIMQGNRENYVKKLRLFAAKVQIPDSYIDVDEYCTNFFAELEDFGKDTQKNFFVLKEFFGNTVSKINNKLKKLEDLFIQLKRLLEKENISKVTEIRGLFKKLEDTRTELAEIKEKKQDYESEIKILSGEKEKILKKIHSIEHGNDYRFYKQFLDEKKDLQQKEVDERKELYAIFSEIEKGMKKYSKKSLKKELVEQYLKNPIESLVKDEKLEIVGILQKLKKEAEKGNLDLKTKKKQKTVETIQKMSKKYFEEKKQKLSEIENLKKENEEKIRKNTSSLQIREQKSYLENTEKEVSEQSKKLEMLNNKIESTNPNLILQNIGKALAEFSGKNVKWKR